MWNPGWTGVPVRASVPVCPLTQVPGLVPGQGETGGLRGLRRECNGEFTLVPGWSRAAGSVMREAVRARQQPLARGLNSPGGPAGQTVFLSSSVSPWQGISSPGFYI